MLRITNFALTGLLGFTVTCDRHDYRIVAQFPEIANPGLKMCPLNGNLFITDSGSDSLGRGTTIHQVDLKEFQWLRKIGGPGKGPGLFEIQDGHDVILGGSEEGLVVSSFGKISRFTLQGDLIETLHTPPGYHTEFRPFGRGFVGHSSYQEGETWYYQIHLYDEHLQIRKDLCRQVNDGMPFYSGYLYALLNDRLYVVGRTRDFDIDVYDNDGKLLDTIHHEYTRVPVTDEHKEVIFNFFAANPAWAPHMEEIRQSTEFPVQHQAIADLWTAMDRLYVVTRHQSDRMREIWVLDVHGGIIRKTTMPLNMTDSVFPSPYAIDGDWLYQLVRKGAGNGWNLLRVPIR